MGSFANQKQNIHESDRVPDRQQVFSLFLTSAPILSAKPWPDGLSIRASRTGLEKPEPFNATRLFKS
jgi:hypothetical protein